MPYTISDWIIALEMQGFKDKAAAFHTDKIEDYQMLKQSGLPVYDDIIVPFADFTYANVALEQFFIKYSGFVVRAIPDAKDLPRRYKKGVSSFAECHEFLEDVVNPSDRNRYKIFLSEYESSSWSGIIISRQGDALIEIAQAECDDLSHGEVIPSGGHFAFHGNYHMRTMRYNTEDIPQREQMWRALQYLRKDLPTESETFPNVDFRKGYFEFVITAATNRIKFIDFKVNEMYLK